MENEKSGEVKKAVERPFYGSQEQPARESAGAPANQGPTKGKPRPPSS